MTPRRRSSSLNCETAFEAPRNLKLPMGCRLSGFRYAAASVTEVSRTSGVCSTTSRSRSRALANSSAVTRSVRISMFVVATVRSPMLRIQRSDFQNNRHDEGPARRLLLDVALQVDADLFLDQHLVGTLLRVRLLKGLADDSLGLLSQFKIAGDEAARHKLRHALYAAGELVDGDDRDNQSILAQVAAVSD